jgi:four helix bundle protein
MMDLKDRTKQFAIDIIHLCSSLPQKEEFQIDGRQLIRSVTSVGANYRSARRAKSQRDFLAKLSIVEEEADESLYWLGLLEGLGLRQNEVLLKMKDEADQLEAIVVASKKTVHAKLKGAS